MTRLNNFLSKLTLTTNKLENLFFLLVVTFITSTFFAVVIHFITMSKNTLTIANS